MLKFPTAYVDNFYEDPDYIREYALKQHFFKVEDDSVNCERTHSIQFLNNAMLNDFSRRLFSIFYDIKLVPITWEIETYFLKIYPGSTLKIEDNTKFILAGQVFLDNAPNTNNGVALFNSDFSVESKIAKTSEINNVYNRLVCYDGSCYSKSNFTESSENFRLSQVFVVKGLLAQNTPVDRIRSASI